MSSVRLLANLWAGVFCLIFVYATSSDGQEIYEPTDRRGVYLGVDRDGLSPELKSQLAPELRSQLSPQLAPTLSSDACADLHRELLVMPRADYLSLSAMAYVEEDGFLPTEIMGPIQLEPDGKEFMVAFREGKTYVLDLPFIGPPVNPGVYWTSGWGSAWSVMLPDGETANYWVSREL